MFAVAGFGELAGACCFCKAAFVCGGGFGQASRGMLLLRSGVCWRWQLGGVQTLSQAQGDLFAVAAGGRVSGGNASFAGRRVLAVAGVGELAGAYCFLQSGAC